MLTLEFCTHHLTGVIKVCILPGERRSVSQDSEMQAVKPGRNSGANEARRDELTLFVQSLTRRILTESIG